MKFGCAQEGFEGAELDFIEPESRLSSKNFGFEQLQQSFSEVKSL